MSQSPYQQHQSPNPQPLQPQQPAFTPVPQQQYQAPQQNNWQPQQQNYAMQQVPQQQPYQQQYVQAPIPAGVKQKSKMAAGLMGVFLGGLGIHNFYLGRVGRGVVQLLMSLLSAGFLFGVSVIWSVIEGILILSSKPGSKWHKDARGIELSD